MQPLTSVLRWAVLVVICLPLFACFEDPIQEHVHLSLRGTGPVIVTVVQTVAPSERAQSNDALADRLQESRDTVGSGLDPWSRRLALEQPLAERQTSETVDGELRRVLHSAVLETFDEVLRLLEADGLTGSLVVADRIADLQLYPTGGSRATAMQQQEADRRLREWAAQIAYYLAAISDLYSYLDSRPDRAAACFAHLFDMHDGTEAAEPLTSEEEDLAGRAKEEMELVADALLVPNDVAFSLNELTRLVFDPFPARLTIAVDGLVQENIGFVDGGGFFERPSVDAWSALTSLEGRWVSPDPVTAAVSPAPDDRQPQPDPSAFAALNRSWSEAPTAAEVEQALLDLLTPEEMLALRWRATSAADVSDASGTPWMAIMAAAEAALPD